MPSKASDWEKWLAEARLLYSEADSAHDFSHIVRVCSNARQIGEREGANMRVLMLAAMLHDAGSLPKDAGQKEPGSVNLGPAEDFLRKKGIADDERRCVLYAIDVHRFSKGVSPVTLEARILQDADRLDAMGAIGIARLFLTGGAMRREFYHPSDPFCKSREPDDRKWDLDHFFAKLLRLESGMHTETARAMAKRRAEVMKKYLQDLEMEIQG
ncbi:MAG: HD domain-containing protein [Methanotrichaceae archaeon]|nr:HD domain-containing protein [Methanotrichaceae archaeon]